VASRRRLTPVVAFSGPSGSGKTTLLERLLPALARRGIRAGAVKHSGHPHSFDVPGKDSDRLLRAGAAAVAVQGPTQLAWFGPPRPSGARALARLLPRCDLVLAEGFKSERLPRVEVHRRAVGGAFLCARDRGVIAVVSDEPPPRRLPTFAPDDVEGLADFLEARLRAGRRRRRRAAPSM
jgi:molybdopterin-guanine dinucleotide biosynthesis protein B